MQNTIFALSSGFLPSSIAVVRISGSMTSVVVESLFGELPKPRMASYGTLRSKNRESIDKGIVIFFQSPESFTGEDVAEFYLHGSKAVVEKLFSEFFHWPSLRHAEAGEFTKRAFLNGKLDLTEAEAISDLIFAETETQRRLALQNLEGSQSSLYANWRKRILHAQAFTEAALDFSDESDVSSMDSEPIIQDMKELLNDISNYIKRFRCTEIIRDGYEVVIIGLPNAGKSSFLNCLSGRDAAIVSEEPGTTRDLIEIDLNLNGIRIRLVDTAGLRDSSVSVESLGIEKAKKRARQADLVLELQDITSNEKRPHLDLKSDLIVGSKCDRANSSCDYTGYDFVISSLTGEGIQNLLKEIERRAFDSIDQMQNLFPLRLRHVELLSSGSDFILQAINNNELELRAEFLRSAANTLARILGKIDIEDVLDSVFSQFCIGK